MTPKITFKHINPIDLILALGLAVAALGLYLRTLVPGLLPGDSGEFQVLARVLGHTHPTGYPVYLVLAHPLTWLPGHSVAYGVNAFSALMAALAVGGVYLAGRSLTQYRVLALVGSVALALSPTFWSQALIAEVYTPGAAFLIAVVALLLRWERTRSPRLLFLAGLIGGLSLGVHMTVALLAPAVLLFLLLVDGRNLRMWRSAVLGAALGLGLTLLLFLWIDARHAPADYFRLVVEPSASAWDLTPEDLDSPWERLRFDWTAQQFRPFMFRLDVLKRQAKAYGRHLPDEFPLPFLAGTLLGMIVLPIRKPKVGLFLLAALAVQWLFTWTYDIWDLYVFFIPGYVLVALLAVAGLDGVVRGADRLTGRRPRAAAYTAWLLALLMLGFSALSLPREMRQAVVAGETPSFPFEEYPEFDPTLEARARRVVDALPEGSIVLTDWDRMWPYTYAAYLEAGRLDLRFLETYPRDDRPEIADSLVEYIRAHLPQHPIFIEERDRRLRQEGFRLVPKRVGGVRMYRVTSHE